jgi:HSP20 family protein
MNAVLKSIERRAFDIFQARGGVNGNELDDWLRAEAELLHSAHLQLYESDDALAVNAEVPGFHAEELEVIVGTRHVAITGRRPTNHKTWRKTIYCDACAERIFRALGLPVEVDPQKATAALKDGILELLMPKASTPALSERKIYAIVRAQDSWLWTEPFVSLMRSID